jgi:FkbM family methyltransferase
MKAVELAYKGFRFAVPAETEAFWPYYGILFVGEYDPLLKSLRRGDIVLDAGANIGIFTLLASRIAELVIAVEPDPENFSYLKYNIELNRAKNVLPIRKALSNYHGTGYISGKGALKALSLRGSGHAVEVTTIDKLLKDLGLSARGVDAMKMDIEGSEIHALDGDYLENLRVLMLETHGRRTLEHVRSILKNRGFSLAVWRFSYTITILRILKGVKDFIRAECSTGFAASRAVISYIASGFKKHPVPASTIEGGYSLIYAWRES